MIELMPQAYIRDAVRTPVGRYGGALAFERIEYGGNSK